MTDFRSACTCKLFIFSDCAFSRKFYSSRRELAINQVSFILMFYSRRGLLKFYYFFEPSDALLPFKKGSFHLAIQAQCSIQPIVVSRYTFLDSKAKIFGRGHSIIKVLPVVETKGLKKTDVEALVSNVQKIMQENYEKLNDEMAANIHMK